MPVWELNKASSILVCNFRYRYSLSDRTRPCPRSPRQGQWPWVFPALVTATWAETVSWAGVQLQRDSAVTGCPAGLQLGKWGHTRGHKAEISTFLPASEVLPRGRWGSGVLPLFWPLSSFLRFPPSWWPPTARRTDQSLAVCPGLGSRCPAA